MTDVAQALEEIAACVDMPCDAARLDVAAPADVYGSPFRVSDAAAISVTAATWSVALLESVRSNAPVPQVHVDSRHAAVTFHSERLLSVPTLEGEHIWDPVTGNYATADGWVRLHANVTAHRSAVLRVLDVPAQPQAVARAALSWQASALEGAVLDAGGVAAQMRTHEQWQLHPQRAAVVGRPVIDLSISDGGRAGSIRGPALEGLRVLDLTRVIAGPVAGRFLASFGADVLRVDAPQLDDMLLFEIDTGFGKRRVTLDLRTRDDRAMFESLISRADVVLEAFRPGALAGLGYHDEALRQVRPGLVTGHLSAYGDRGPWRQRRGFDSVVQVGCGIAHACGFDPDTGPGALPAQALDHASGYLLATGVVAALAHRERDGRGGVVNLSLARTAEWLTALGTREDVSATAPDAREVGDLLAWRADTSWGPVRHVRAPGRVGERDASWDKPPLPRGAGSGATSGW